MLIVGNGDFSQSINFMVSQTPWNISANHQISTCAKTSIRSTQSICQYLPILVEQVKTRALEVQMQGSPRLTGICPAW